MAHLLVLAAVCAVLLSICHGAKLNYGAPPTPKSDERRDMYEASSLLRAENFQVAEAEALARLAEAIPGGGVPGEDYPILSSIPETDFSCDEQNFPGYYVDVSDEAKCQVFHICQEGGRKDSFMCPIGTLFRQEYFVCDWWFNVDCRNSEEFFRLNENIGKIPEEDVAQTRAETLDTYLNGEISVGLPVKANGGGASNGRKKSNGREEARREEEAPSLRQQYLAPEEAISGQGYQLPSVSSRRQQPEESSSRANGGYSRNGFY